MTILDHVFETSEISLENKSALITGASSGIGLATAAWLAREGVHLNLVARRSEKLMQIQHELLLQFPKIKINIISADVTNKNIIEILREQNALDVDILINNAGLAAGKEHVIHAVEEDIENMINTNITAAFKIARAVGQRMVLKQSGHIINLGSVAGHYTYEGGAVYCATKFAVRAFGEALRQELYNKNIRVSTISPGAVKTEFSIVRFKGDTQKADAVYENFEYLRASDIARLIIKTLKEPTHVNLDEVIVLSTPQTPVSYKMHRVQSK